MAEKNKDLSLLWGIVLVVYCVVVNAFVFRLSWLWFFESLTGYATPPLSIFAAAMATFALCCSGKYETNSNDDLYRRVMYVVIRPIVYLIILSAIYLCQRVSIGFGS